MTGFADYPEALGWLLGLPNWEAAPPDTRPRPDVARPRALFARLGVAAPSYPVAVIAGTNGKGSTAAILERVLRAAGHRVGLYTQPHLHSYRERIQIDRALIAPEAFAARLARVRDAIAALAAEARELGAVTTYEAATALALLHFAEERVDVAVLEVGLGGRLDAVNALAASVAVLTPIAIDHAETLGDTLAAIAAEKADVIEPAAVAVTAPQASEALAVLARAAEARGADLRLVVDAGDGARGADGGRTLGTVGDEPLPYRFSAAADTGGQQRALGLPLAVRREGATIVGRRATYTNLQLGLLGDHQWTNAAVAVAAAEALAERGLALPSATVAQGLARAYWPGRLEVLAPGPPMVLADGAHNPAGAAALAAALARYFPAPRRLLVLGVSSDKDVAGIVAALAPAVARVYATEALHPRAASREVVARAARAVGLAVKTIPDVAAAIRFARLQRGRGDLIVVAGSLYLVAEARVALGHARDVDPSPL